MQAYSLLVYMRGVAPGLACGVAMTSMYKAVSDWLTDVTRGGHLL